jgi:hypothetical protein
VKKRKRGTVRKASRPIVKVSSTHPLVGTWEEQPNIGGTTTVVYKVSVKQGSFVVTAWDSEDATALKISRVRWDGDALRFTSFYPPGEHTANHVLRHRSKGERNFRVSGTYTDGESFSMLEVWIRSQKQAPKDAMHHNEHRHRREAQKS